MCKKPLSLKNPCKHFDVGSDRVMITVPCNHCSDCNNNKRFQWQVRVYYEYLKHHDFGGFTLFMTLTYNDAHLPHVTIKKLPQIQYDEFGRAKTKSLERIDFQTGEVNIEREVLDYSFCRERISCFNKHHLQQFTKNVKQELRDHHPGVSMQYFISSEYGDDKLYVDRHGNEKIGTHRPHYHCLFFFSSGINIEVAKEILSRHWKGKKFGHVDFTSRPGVVTDRGKVDGPGAIGYVCKYVQKDFNNDKILRQHLEHFVPNLAEDFNLPTSAHDVLPFNMQSQGMGMYIVEYTNKNYPGLIEKGKCKFPMYQDGSKRVSFEVIDLPQYVERKEFCLPQSVTPNRAYIYSERGKAMLVNRMLRRREDLVEQIETLLRDYNSMIEPQLLKVINLKSNRNYLRAKDFIDDIKSNLEGYSIRQLVDYSLLCKNYLSDTNGHYVNDVLSSELSVSQFVSLLNFRLVKDRSIDRCISSKKSVFDEALRNRNFVNRLERALQLYQFYQFSLAEIEELAIQKKIELQVIHAPYLKTRSYASNVQKHSNGCI